MTKTKSQSNSWVIDSGVIRRIRQHARSNMKTEVCGVLIGNHRQGAIFVDECIPGVNAAQAGSHVTFTQDTWEHVYKIKDKEFPQERIVGWYHSHPGFGVFLSDHDTFIHKNFFSSRDQMAWVYDPHSDEEGCFGWVDERLERIASIRISDARGGEPVDPGSKHEPIISEVADQEDIRSAAHSSSRPEGEPAWARWTITILSHLAALFLGLVITWFLFPRLVLIGVPVDPRTGRPLVQSTPLQPGAAANRNDPRAPVSDINKESLENPPSTPTTNGLRGRDADTRR